MKVSLSDQLTYRAYIIQAAALASADHFYSQSAGRKKRAATRRGKSARVRVRRSVVEIYHCLGPIYFCRAYRMTFTSFWHLHDSLEAKIEDVSAKIRGYNRKDTHGANWSAPPIPNGLISSSVRLGIALQYFAGGSAYDIMVKFGV